MTHQLWAADPHEYGPGKSHIVDDTCLEKTLCGRFVSAIPGSWSKGKATCRICLNAVVARPERERQNEKFRAEQVERERLRAEENEKWQRWYSQYLLSPEWRARRTHVLKRANGVCEGCGANQATEVHHVTYRHVGREFLWELRAICGDCHDLVTALDREARAAR